MKNWIITVLGLFCVGLSVYAFNLKQSLGALEAEREHAALQEKISDAELASNEAATKAAVIAENTDSEPDAVAAVVEETPVEETPVEEARASREERRREAFLQFAARFDDPEARMNMVDERLSRVDGRYSDFFLNSGLSLEQIDIVKTMLAERDVIEMESRVKRRTASTDEERAAVAAAMAQGNAIVDAEIASAIGEGLASELNHYTETEEYRRDVDSLSESLSYTSSPISDTQSEALVSVMATAADSFAYTNDLSQVRGNVTSNYSESEIETYWEERVAYEELLITNASQILNDEQLATFVEQQVTERESEQRRMESGGFGGGGGRNGGGPPR